jgi:hypothetical protein
MVGMTSYNVDNDRRFRNALDSAIKSVSDLRFPMGEISRDIFKNTIKNFILSGAGQYEPLSPIYKKWKARKYRKSLIFNSCTSRHKTKNHRVLPYGCVSC